jgi:hypothetical protein
MEGVQYERVACIWTIHGFVGYYQLSYPMALHEHEPTQAPAFRHVPKKAVDRDITS